MCSEVRPPSHTGRYKETVVKGVYTIALGPGFPTGRWSNPEGTVAEELIR